MKILMMTNTYKPHVGGVANSVDSFAREYRSRGHQVIIVAPEFEGMDDEEPDVIRLPAICNFNGSDFSVRIPVPLYLRHALEKFRPDIVHSHHPFMVGDTAIRVASTFNVPIVFTHHTRYEDYTHYVPGNSEPMKTFAKRLATYYANLTDTVFAPSESIRDLITERGVAVPIAVVPTGVNPDDFQHGDGARWRREHQINPNDFVVGHVGRLAPEKNIEFLCDAVAGFVGDQKNAIFAVVGDGPALATIKGTFSDRGLSEKLRVAGKLTAAALADAYCAMDVFAFASRSETQGMVLTEAMAARTPVVAVNASGVREILEDKINGRMIDFEDRNAFIAALKWVDSLDGEGQQKLIAGLDRTVEKFSMKTTATRALDIYAALIARHHKRTELDDNLWVGAIERIKTEWELVKEVVDAAADTVLQDTKG